MGSAPEFTACCGKLIACPACENLNRRPKNEINEALLICNTACPEHSRCYANNNKTITVIGTVAAQEPIGDSDADMD